MQCGTHVIHFKTIKDISYLYSTNKINSKNTKNAHSDKIQIDIMSSIVVTYCKLVFYNINC